VTGARRIAPELAARARARPDERMSVLIEADLPSPRATVRQRSGSPGADVVEVRDLSPAEARKRDRRVDALRALLRDVVGSEPRLFKYANAFGVTVTREQLARIAKSRLVRCVRENRRLPS
jgi:hypothetical protein